MTKFVVILLLIAVLLFWAVGAYNRLVRLRSDVVRAFAAVDEVLSVLPALIQAALQMHGVPEVGVDTSADAGANRSSLRRDCLTAAGQQFARALANARARPLDPELAAALREAQDGLDGVWRSTPAPKSEHCPADWPDGLQVRVARLADESRVPAALFDEAVQTYNAAIRQFPALVLARIWGFRPAACLQARGMDEIQNKLRIDD